MQIFFFNLRSVVKPEYFKYYMALLLMLLFHVVLPNSDFNILSSPSCSGGCFGDKGYFNII